MLGYYYELSLMVGSGRGYRRGRSGLYGPHLSQYFRRGVYDGYVHFCPSQVY